MREWMQEEKGSHSRPRLEWLDALKGFAILSVVLGHVLLGYSENNMFPEVNSYMQVLMKWIYTWHMPLFFTISGFAFSLSYFEDKKINIRKIFRGGANLFLIYLIFSMTLGVLKILFASLVDNPMDVREMFVTILLPNTLMWYLWVLIAFYIVFGVVINKNVPHTLLAFVLFALVFVGSMLAEVLSLRLCVKNLFCCALYFDMGLCLGTGRWKRYEKNRSRVMIAAALTTLLFAGAFTACFDAYEELPLACRILFETCNAISIAILLFGIFSNMAVTGMMRGLAQLGKASLIIYLIHTYVVTAIKVAVKRCEFENAFIAVLCAWCIAVAMPYFLFLLSRKVRLIGWIFKPIRGVDWVSERIRITLNREI